MGHRFDRKEVDSEIDGVSAMTYRIDRLVGARVEQKFLDWAIRDERTSGLDICERARQARSTAPVGAYRDEPGWTRTTRRFRMLGQVGLGTKAASVIHVDEFSVSAK